MKPIRAGSNKMMSWGSIVPDQVSTTIVTMSIHGLDDTKPRFAVGNTETARESTMRVAVR